MDVLRDMLLKETSNTRSPGFYSLLHLANLEVFLPKLQYEGTREANDDSDSFATLVLYILWAILYLSYKTSLNSILRRMQLPFVRRNRIIDASWYCGFSACSMVFLTYFGSESNDRSCPWRRTSNLQLGVTIQETFYLHRATIQVFVYNRWLKGWTIQLFASEMITSLREKWPAALMALLFYEASDLALLNSCRILLTLSRRKIVKRVAKLLFLLHFINWIYIHVLLVPGSLILLYFDDNRNWKIQVCLSMWLICEYLNSIRNKEFDCLYLEQSLDTSIFPPPSREATELVNILKRHKKSIDNKVVEETSKHKHKTELWQTLFCAMTIKKKLKKRGQAKKLKEERSIDLH